MHGRGIQLQMVDDAYVPDRTLSNVKQILSSGSALALLSCVGTPNNTAILPLIDEAGLVLRGSGDGCFVAARVSQRSSTC